MSERRGFVIGRVMQALALVDRGDTEQALELLRDLSREELSQIQADLVQLLGRARAAS